MPNFPQNPDSSLSKQRFALSIADLQGAATRGAAMIPYYLPERRVELLPLNPPGIMELARCGMQELLNLSDDLLLVRSDYHAKPALAEQGRRWEIDTRGWLYLHCRLDGLTVEETPDGVRRTLGGGCFLLSASSQRQSFVREMLSDDWRVVTIAFRPSFAMRDLRVPGVSLPTELRRFQAGDSDIDFWYANQLTSDMKAAVGALLEPAVRTDFRPVYLRAKVVELVCLAVERLSRPESAADSVLKLSQRDVRSLEEARRVLSECSESLSLEQLARRVGLNRRKLALGFRQLFGITAGDYQREVRLELARRLLEKPTTSVGYAAAVAGYADVGSFGKAFRARYGRLPSQMRPMRAVRK